ncbi:MAG: DUF58 domain-containing protein [Gemmatimonadetes bacterium]|nr:DUF58 domain-containing protein [Gemmatimonadota bacterium]
MTGPDFIAPHLLERLGGLDLIARTVVSGLATGQHRSTAQGAGGEFHRHRAYQQGDDLRNLDWRVYARTDRLFVREYRSDSNLQAYLVLDSTLSMSYADRHGVTKRRYAAYLGAALAHLMLRGGDHVGVASYGEAPHLHLLAGRRAGQLQAVLRVLERLEPSGRSGAAGGVDRAGMALRRRGRLVLLSDLLEEDGGDALVSSLGRVRARGDEVIVLCILTPEERGEEPAPAGLVYDPERPEISVPAVPHDDAGYVERVRTYYDGLAARMAEVGVEFVSFSTTTPVDRGLDQWLRARRS